MRVIRSSRAERDMEDIWLFIAQHNQRAATGQLDHIEEAIQKIADFPRVGHTRSELPEDVRVVPAGSYLVLYKLVPEGVLIITVRQGSRDLRNALEDSD